MEEPHASKTGGAFAACLEEYSAQLDDPGGHGAVLFAVCRGKVGGVGGVGFVW